MKKRPETSEVVAKAESCGLKIIRNQHNSIWTEDKAGNMEIKVKLPDERVIICDSLLGFYGFVQGFDIGFNYYPQGKD